jgi:hypothetical protein
MKVWGCNNKDPGPHQTELLGGKLDDGNLRTRENWFDSDADFNGHSLGTVELQARRR